MEWNSNSIETRKVLLSVLLPCLNEALGIEDCIKKTQQAIERLNINTEIVVIDNGSSDQSVDIARKLGVRIIFEPKKGYGNVCRRGFREAKGEYIIMADADDTYDLTQIHRFIEPLMNGYDFVIGSRFKGKIFSGAMPWAHRYLGNPILTKFLKYLFGAKISDAHCGIRAITKKAYSRLNLITSGMEFASEMIVSALKNNFNITEVPVDYYPRKGKSKLMPFRDAWRHIRFLLIFSPTHLFLIPGLTMFISGTIILITMLFGSIKFAGHKWDIHFMVVSSLITLLGFQFLNLGIYAKIYSLTQGFIQEDKIINKFLDFFNLERGLILGCIIFLIGFGFNIFILAKWIYFKFGALNEIRRAIFALTFTAIGAQIIFSSFFLSILGIQKYGQD